MNGATRMVASRSRRSGITRVAMIPGTAQAKLESMGMNEWPESPVARIRRSIRKAKRIRIWGRKTTTLPTPAITPSASRLASAPSPRAATTAPARAAAVPSIASISGVAHEKTAWKTSAISATKIRLPKSGWTATRSMRSEAFDVARPTVPASTVMASASSEPIHW